MSSSTPHRTRQRVLVRVAERTEVPIGMSRRKTVAISTCIQEVGRDEQ